MQEQAWQELKRQHSDGFSFRIAADFVRKNYMLDLGRAPFPIADATLVAKAGACGACPKRTGAQPDLFPDVKNGNVCTDPACFNAKRDAANKAQIAAAEQKGREVIVGALMPWQNSVAHGSGFAMPSDRCYDDAKSRSWSQLAKLAGVEPTLIHNPHTRELEPIVPVEKVKRALTAKGIKLSRPQAQASKAMRDHRARVEADRAKRERESEARRRAWTELRGKIRKLETGDLVAIASALWCNSYAPQLDKAWPTLKTRIEPDAAIAKLRAPELARLLVDLTIDAELDGYRKPRRLATLCKRHGVNIDRHRRAIEAERRAKQKAAAPAKKGKRK
jgi:hypothetical protein